MQKKNNKITMLVLCMYMEAGNSEIVTLLKSGALKHVYSGEGLLILMKGKKSMKLTKPR